MRRVLPAVVIALAIATTWMVALPPPPAERVPFSHVRHGDLACPICHRGAESDVRAGLPERATCQNCHAARPPSVAVDAWEAARAGWVPVTRVPDHVRFSHRRHVGIGRLACVSCHGDVALRDAPPRRPPLRLDMAACLSCHKAEGMTADCVACHR